MHPDRNFVQNCAKNASESLPRSYFVENNIHQRAGEDLQEILGNKQDQLAPGADKEDEIVTRHNSS